MAVGWELQDFGPCIAEWLQSEPPIAWRKPLHTWITGIKSDVINAARREPALDDDDWSGWYCEVPDASGPFAVVVVYYLVSKRHPVAKCVQISTEPRYRE